ncbi:MAG: DUF4292 domain-containing protein [Chitinophagales bacterium]|jgi:hypothetical protein|nr:DUF4292 domain-containing protein [Chitinophagales bacterium]
MLKNKILHPYTVFLFLVLGMLLSSCKPKKGTVNKGSALAVPSIQRIDPALRPFAHQYDYFSFKTKLDYEDGRNAFLFTANIRIRQDSLIWVSITGPLNIEVARAIISIDSVKIMNKMSGEKERYPIQYLSKYFPGEVDYFLIQDFLLGNPLAASKAPCVMDTSADVTQFTQQDAKLKVVHHGNTKNYTLQDVLLKDILVNQQLDATFEDYQKVDSNAFSCARNIQIQRGAQLIKIKGEVYKFRAHEPLEFPF